MKKTFKRQSKTLNSKSKKRTMKAMKGGAWKLAPPVMKPVGGPRPGPGKPVSGYEKPIGEPTTKYTPQITMMTKEIEQIKTTQEQIRKETQKLELSKIDLKYSTTLSPEKRQEIMSNIILKKSSIASKQEEASKGKPLAVMQAKLEELQELHKKKLAKQMEKKKPSKDEALKIMAETLRLWKK